MTLDPGAAGRGPRSRHRPSRRRSRSRTGSAGGRPARRLVTRRAAGAAARGPDRTGLVVRRARRRARSALVGYFLNAIGAGASLIGMLLALVPLTGVLLAVRLVDRWEPEPRGLLAFAVAWGAIAAVAIALGVDLLITTAFAVPQSPGTRGVHRDRAGADRRGGREGHRRVPHLRRRPACIRRSDRRDRLRRPRRRGVRVHREHPVLRDQLHRGRGRRGLDDVLRARHPLAVRPRDVHERHRASRSDLRPGAGCGRDGRSARGCSA